MDLLAYNLRIFSLNFYLEIIRYLNESIVFREFVKHIFLIGAGLIYVVLSDIWLGRESETYMTAQGNAASMAGDPMGTGYTTYKYFMSKCKYAFYDTKTGKLLGYGHAEGKAQYQFAVTKGDWEFALRDMVGKVLTNTPVVSW